jgi:hypothetical protein
LVVQGEIKITNRLHKKAHCSSSNFWRLDLQAWLPSVTAFWSRKRILQLGGTRQVVHSGLKLYPKRYNGNRFYLLNNCDCAH